MNHLTLASETIMFAKAYGIYFAVLGVAIAYCPSRFRSWYEDLLEEPRRVLFGGTLSLLIGSFIVATHNIIIPDWRIVITLIGYWGVFSGAGCLIFNDFIKLFKPMVNSSNLIYRLSGIGWLLLGLFLINQGF